MQGSGIYALQHGWNLARRHPELLGYYLLVFVAPAILLPNDPELVQTNFGTLGLAMILVVIAQAWLMAAMLMIALADVRGQDPVSILAAPFGLVFRLIYAGVVQAVLIVLGLILLVIPGLYLMLVWSQTPFLIVDGVSPNAAIFRESFRITEGRKWFTAAALSWAALPLVPVMCVRWMFALTQTSIPFGIGMVLATVEGLAAIVLVFGSAWVYHTLKTEADRRDSMTAPIS